MDVTVTENGNIAIPFHWVDKKGVSHLPKNMSTMHLFYTLRMIWNHTMPGHMRTHDYTHYSFGPAYTVQYLMDAIRALMTELACRKDLPQSAQAQLASMVYWSLRDQRKDLYVSAS